MNELLTVNNILSKNYELSKAELTIEAFLIITKGDCFLSPGVSFTEYNRFIQVCCPDLENTLDELVGGWVGGEAVYNDRVHITGVLEIGTTRIKPLIIKDISKFILFRDNEEFLISR